MIMSRFRSMGLAAGAAASVLSCYMVSLRVARERGEVQRIEQQIVDAHRDIRDLTTELGTRGRMRQLERWNSDVLALSAPGAAQYLNGTVELASYQPATVEATPAIAAAAVATVSAAPADTPKAIPAVEVTPATHDTPRLVTASYKPKAVKKAKDADAGPVRIASAKTKAKAKTKTSDDKLVRTASLKAKASKAKALASKVVRTASFKKAPTKSAGPNAGLIHTASYVTTHNNGPTRVALLDDRVLNDIGRAAAHEVKTGRKAVP